MLSRIHEPFHKDGAGVWNRFNQISRDKRVCSREKVWLLAKTPSIKSRLAAAWPLGGQCERWNRAWVPRLWDQGSHLEDSLRPTDAAPLPG